MLIILSVCSAVSVVSQEQNSLPHVLIEGFPQNDYSQCKFTFVSADSKDSLSIQANIKWRGHNASNYDKKSFAIKFVNDNGKKHEIKFLDMRKDNKWILDAMAVDKARMRNRVSFDLWNEFSSQSYIAGSNKNTENGTRGNFVEVYLNGEYHGIYCLTEIIDRKQLKLKKHDKHQIHGLLYKSEGFQYTTFWDIGPYDNTQVRWGSWEAKYPDVKDGENIDWKPLFDATEFLLNSTEEDFLQNIEKRFDMPVWTDYFIFSHLILAYDNHAKNMYTYFL